MEEWRRERGHGPEAGKRTPTFVHVTCFSAAPSSAMAPRWLGSYWRMVRSQTLTPGALEAGRLGRGARGSAGGGKVQKVLGGGKSGGSAAGVVRWHLRKMRK